MKAQALLLAFCLFAALPLQAQPPRTGAAGGDALVVDLSGISRESYDNPLVMIDTTRGRLLVELFPAEAPETVANFLALAKGEKAFLDPASRQWVTRPFYDGLHVHRVVGGQFIQAGSPGNEAGIGPGFSVDDEISARSLGLDQIKVIDPEGRPHPWLGIRNLGDFQRRILRPLYRSMGLTAVNSARERERVDERLREMTLKELYTLEGYRYDDSLISRPPVQGVIAMAGGGARGDGAQFFITLADLPWLTGRHTVFGKVRGGLDVLEAIGRVPADGRGRPLDPVVILSVRQVD